jgi:hypothetical protein
MLPWPVWPLAGHARLGQNTVVGSMMVLLLALLGNMPREVCLDPRLSYKQTSPRFSAELPGTAFVLFMLHYTRALESLGQKLALTSRELLHAVHESLSGIVLIKWG